MKGKSRRRWIIAAILLLIILLIGRPLVLLSYHYLSDPTGKALAVTRDYANDASHMDETKMDSVMKLDSKPYKAEKQLQDLVLLACRQHRCFPLGRPALNGWADPIPRRYTGGYEEF